MAVMLLFAALVSVFYAVYRWLTSRPKNFPPGPAILPFLGNILTFRKQPHLAMAEWKAKYGDVFSIYDGRKPMVVLSNYITVRKVFGLESAAGRDESSVVRVDAATQSRVGLIFADGDDWKEHRRFAQSTLRSLGMGGNWLEDAILAEVEAISEIFRNTNQVPIDPKIQLTNSFANVICVVIFGRRFELNDPNFIKLTKMVTENLAGLAVDSMVQALPFLMWFPNTMRDKVIKTRSNFRALSWFLREMVATHGAETVNDKSVPSKNYLDAYKEAKECYSKFTTHSIFDETQLLASMSDLFRAGTESAATTALWALVFATENPDVVTKVQEEIDNKVGRHNVITNGHRGILSYTEAFILEVQRRRYLPALVLPHRTREEITIDGYTIPKNTLVVSNPTSIHRDARWWGDPELFDPTRFLNDKGKVTRPDGFLGFSVGKRACPGETLARMELFLFIGNLLRCFTLSVPLGRMSVYKDTASPSFQSPMPFELVFIPRV